MVIGESGHSPSNIVKCREILTIPTECGQNTEKHRQTLTSINKH